MKEAEDLIKINERIVEATLKSSRLNESIRNDAFEGLLNKVWERRILTLTASIVRLKERRKKIVIGMYKREMGTE